MTRSSPSKAASRGAGAVLEIGEDIVLDDGEAELVGELQHPVSRHRRQRGAGRIVDPGIGDVEPRAVLGERLAEQLDVRAGRRVGHADDPGAVGSQQGLEVEVAGVVDQHRIARLEQQTAQQVYGLRSAFGQHDLIRRGLDAAIGHAPDDELSKRRQPERRSVVRQGRTVGAGERSKRPPQAVDGEPGRRQPPAAGFQDAVAGFERLPRHPERIDGAVEPGADIGQRQRRRPAGDVEAGAGPASGSRLRRPGARRLRPPSRSIPSMSPPAREPKAASRRASGCVRRCAA